MCSLSLSLLQISFFLKKKKNNAKFIFLIIFSVHTLHFLDRDYTTEKNIFYKTYFIYNYLYFLLYINFFPDY